MPGEHELWIEEILKQDDELKMTEKQVRIIRSAIEMFSEKGYASTSTSEIAHHAGVAEGTIFRHYKTKKDLLIAIVAPTMTKLIAPFLLKDFRHVLDTPYETYEDFLRAIITNRLEFARRNQAVLKILLQEIPFHPELRNLFKEYVMDNVGPKVTAIVQHFQQNGQVIAGPPASLVRLSTSAIMGFILTRFFIAPELNWDEEQEIELTIHFILHGLSA